jgi:hypothetical protein
VFVTDGPIKGRKNIGNWMEGISARRMIPGRGILRRTWYDLVRLQSVGGCCVAFLGVEPSDPDALHSYTKGGTSQAGDVGSLGRCVMRQSRCDVMGTGRHLR